MKRLYRFYHCRMPYALRLLSGGDIGGNDNRAGDRNRRREKNIAPDKKAQLPGEHNRESLTCQEVEKLLLELR